VAAGLYALGAFAGRRGWLRAHLLRQPTLGWALVGAAACVFAWAAAQFWRERTTIVPAGSPSRLVESGPFRFSRNPIYVADLLATAGIALLGGAVRYWLVVPLLAAALAAVYVPHEEAKLRAAFGAAFDAYAARVRRWL